MLPNDKISPRQFLALCFVSMLSPLIRHVPTAGIPAAGAGLWLSVLLSAVPLAGLFFLVRALLHPKAGGLCQTMCRVLGGFTGKTLLLLYCGWFIFFAGYILRSGAERFVTTIYPSSSTGIFVILMLVVCIPAVLGQLKALARSAMLMRPILLGILSLVFLFSIPDIDLGGLWQLSGENDVGILSAAVTVFNPISVAAYAAFVSDQTEGQTDFRRFVPWLAVVLIVTELICLSVIGMFGAEMSAKLNNPFFVMVRDISFFGTIERVEAIVIAAWVFSDFILVSLLLYTVGRIIGFVFGMVQTGETDGSVRPGAVRWSILLCAGTALGVGLSIAPDSAALLRFAQTLIPVLNLIFATGIPLIVYLVGKFRGKL